VAAVIKPTQTRRDGAFSGNLGALGEGRVRFKIAAQSGAKSQASGFAGLAGSAQNRYIDRNLWFSYDSVLRVGPFRTRSFLLPERA
jgi:hypothetical protein